MSRPRTSITTIIKVRHLYAAGMTYAEIRRRCGVSDHVINTYCETNRRPYGGSDSQQSVEDPSDTMYLMGARMELMEDQQWGRRLRALCE